MQKMGHGQHNNENEHQMCIELTSLHEIILPGTGSGPKQNTTVKEETSWNFPKLSKDSHHYRPLLYNIFYFPKTENCTKSFICD